MEQHLEDETNNGVIIVAVQVLTSNSRMPTQKVSTINVKLQREFHTDSEVEIIIGENYLQDLLTQIPEVKNRPKMLVGK